MSSSSGSDRNDEASESSQSDEDDVGRESDDGIKKEYVGETEVGPSEDDVARESDDEGIKKEYVGKTETGQLSEDDVARGSDDEEINKESEDETMEKASNVGSTRRKRQSESSQGSDDSYSDDEEEKTRKKPKKKAKTGVSDFILQEAEVDDDLEDDEEWEDGAHELGIVENEIDEVGPTAREIEGRRRISDIFDSHKEEEIEEYLRNKYANEARVAHHFGNGEHMNDEITQQTLLPNIKDPNLWLVKCRIGEEMNTVLLLMRKFLTYQYTNSPLVIKSAVAPKGIKGFIYIEAYKQVHVKAAIENVNNLKLGFWKQQMVPLNEMVDVLRVTSSINIKPNQWVRIKRGIYKDDLAQVDYIELAQNKVHLRLLPRIDYQKLRGALRLMSEEAESTKRKKTRPPAKPFDPEAIRSIGGEVTSNGDYLVFEGNHYSRKGFLFKHFNINAIRSEGIKPTLEEIEHFEDSPENIDIELSDAPATGPGAKFDQMCNFSTGDKVKVNEGELIHLQGKIVSIDGNKIMVMPSHEELNEPIEFMARELRKYFNIGDHVKVLAGKYEGDTGLIVRIEENRIVLFSDVSMHELEVLPINLQLCPDMASGVDRLGKFQWGDLVQLEPQTVGVIVRLERDNFQVLSMHGNVVQASPVSLTKYNENRNTTALDMYQDSIRRKDIVKVLDGPHSGREGEIKHLYRNFAFLYSKVYIHSGGIFVCKTRHLQLVGGLKSKKELIAELTNYPFASPTRSDVSPQQEKGKARVHSSFGGSYPTRDKKLIGTTIRITGGPYKGNIGFVKDATESAVRVELHSPCQTISVDRSHIMNLAQLGPNGTPRNNYTPTYSAGGRTPMYGARQDGSKTPMHGSQTPMQGAQTPMYDTGSRTPYYGSITPSHSEGGNTPRNTGAWDPTVANTPARNSEYDLDDPDDAPSASPMYQESQSSNSMYDPDPSASPMMSVVSPSRSGGITPSHSDMGFMSPNYTPSSPTESNASMLADNVDTPDSPDRVGSPYSLNDVQTPDSPDHVQISYSPASPSINLSPRRNGIPYSPASPSINLSPKRNTIPYSPASPSINSSPIRKTLSYSPASPSINSSPNRNAISYSPSSPNANSSPNESE
ncbi:transcription elongation factor SPT5-like [Nasonia vitripennis]|uniref:Transcription elongation factor SPT5 n=1 Tax=Nasonia vitripennis TaxID=7425 RepID=A0A7M7G2D8_NASVI|nr:transcription elongation factor SPT5-like [Nasonia vitripennis]